MKPDLAVRFQSSSLSNHNDVSGVLTDMGVIECDYFVNCAGIWAREIGKLSEPRVKVPICPAEHFFLSFKGELELLPDQPMPDPSVFYANPELVEFLR